MTPTHDFSRRFFADFIASRIKAWHLGEGRARPAIRTVAADGDDGPSPDPSDSSPRPRSTERAG